MIAVSCQDDRTISCIPSMQQPRKVLLVFGLVCGVVAFLSATAEAQSPAVGFSPTSLSFGSQNIGTTSAAQSVTMTNKGTTTLTITKIYVGGSNSPDFAFQSNTCYPSVSAGASCTITDQFRPSQSGAETAYISIADSATGSPQLVNMTGTGVSSSLSVSLSTTSLSFGSQNIGTTSAGQNVTLTNTGSAALSISSIAVTGSNNGDFAQTNSCGSSLAAGANCTLV